jgi:hypothetical protein
VFGSQNYTADLSDAAEWKNGDNWEPFDHSNDGFKHFQSSSSPWGKKISIGGLAFEGRSHTLVVIVFYLKDSKNNAPSLSNHDMVKGICKVSGPFYI